MRAGRCRSTPAASRRSSASTRSTTCRGARPCSPTGLGCWRPGGRLLFTDPVTVTGLVGSAELAIRSSIGYFDFAPPGEDERLLRAAGLSVLAVEDTTASMAGVARRRLDVRAERAETLKRFEGDDAFERRQQFLEIVATLAGERRISRFTYLAEKPRT